MSYPDKIRIGGEIEPDKTGVYIATGDTYEPEGPDIEGGPIYYNVGKDYYLFNYLCTLSDTLWWVLHYAATLVEDSEKAFWAGGEKTPFGDTLLNRILSTPATGTATVSEYVPGCLIPLLESMHEDF